LRHIIARLTSRAEYATTAWLVVSLRLGVGKGRRSDSEGGEDGAAGSSGATEPSPNGSVRSCVVLKPERARGQQSEQHGRRGCVATRRGARVGPGGLFTTAFACGGHFSGHHS